MLACLSCRRKKGPRDDLIKMVCGFCNERDTIKARDTFYMMLPERQDSKLRRKTCRSMADNVSTVLDLMHVTPPDEPPTLLCRDVCHIPPIHLDTTDEVALSSHFCSLRHKVQGNITQTMDGVKMSLAEQRSLLDQRLDRFTYWNKYMGELTSGCVHQGRRDVDHTSTQATASGAADSSHPPGEGCATPPSEAAHGDSTSTVPQPAGAKTITPRLAQLVDETDSCPTPSPPLGNIVTSHSAVLPQEDADSLSHTTSLTNEERPAAVGAQAAVLLRENDDGHSHCTTPTPQMWTTAITPRHSALQLWKGRTQQNLRQLR